MFYIFHQNNSYGKYLKPARDVVVEADDEASAIEIAQTIDGVYFKGSSDKDCPCCGARWSKFPMEYSPEDFKEHIENKDNFMSWLSPKVPYVYIRYADGSTKTIDNRDENAPSMNMDMPVPLPAEAQESSEPVEGEV